MTLEEFNKVFNEVCKEFTEKNPYWNWMPAQPLFRKKIEEEILKELKK